MERNLSTEDSLDGSAVDSTSIGRWTKEEHDLFLRGLAEHGKDWKQIGSMIKTRTVVQIRTHAQKYFLATKKHEEGGVSSMSLQIAPKQSKEKKRPAPLSPTQTKPLSATMAAKPKAKRVKAIGAEEHENDDSIEGFAEMFELVDEWSSESDEGSPTALDDINLLKIFPPIFGEKEFEQPSAATAVSSSFQDPFRLSQPLPQVPPPPPPVMARQQQPHFYHHHHTQAQHQQQIPLLFPSEHGPSLSEPSQDFPVSFDPLPPSMEFNVIGKWMDDAVPSMVNDAL